MEVVEGVVAVVVGMIVVVDGIFQTFDKHTKQLSVEFFFNFQE